MLKALSISVVACGCAPKPAAPVAPPSSAVLNVPAFAPPAPVNVPAPAAPHAASGDSAPQASLAEIANALRLLWRGEDQSGALYLRGTERITAQGTCYSLKNVPSPVYELTGERLREYKFALENTHIGVLTGCDEQTRCCSFATPRDKDKDDDTNYIEQVCLGVNGRNISLRYSFTVAACEG